MEYLKNGDVLNYSPYYRSKKIFKLKFRVDPIPFTGCYHLNGRTCFRSIRTTQERRWNLAYKEYVRGKRRGHNLPEAWDDLTNSKETIRSWKRTKKVRQWMRGKNCYKVDSIRWKNSYCEEGTDIIVA